MECWKKYNTRIVTSEGKLYDVSTEVDRLGAIHGVTRNYLRVEPSNHNEPDIIENYHQGLLQSSEQFVRPDGIILSHRITRYTYINNVQSEYSEIRQTYCTSYVSSKKGVDHGLNRSYHESGRHVWEEYQHDLKHGLYIKWWEHGGIRIMCTYRLGKRHGVFYEWRHDGYKEHPRIYANGVLIRL
jgi:antitoxin component YwqK of YwqJK toxin-antitoxin module